MSITLDQLPKIQEQINQTLKELLALEDEMLPDIQKRVQQISNLLTMGFNETILKDQASRALQLGLNESQIADLHNIAVKYKSIASDVIAQLQKAIDQAQQEATRYRTQAAGHRKLYVGIISGALSFVLGAMIVWGVQYNRIDRYQNAISETNLMASFINSDCNLKKSYGKYKGQTITCDSSWFTPSEIIAQP